MFLKYLKFKLLKFKLNYLERNLITNNNSKKLLRQYFQEKNLRLLNLKFKCEHGFNFYSLDNYSEDSVNKRAICNIG